MVAPEGSHCETKANGAGSSGGATAPPLALLPRTTKNSQVGSIAQGLSGTAISEANAATATNWSARIAQPSATGSASRSSGPATRVSTSAPTSASANTTADHWRRDS